MFRQSVRHHLDTTFSSIGDTSADEVMEWGMYPSLEGTKKPTAVGGEYNNFNIKKIHLCILCTAPFHNITILPCEHGCILSAPFCLVRMGVYYLHHFTIFVSP